MSPQPNPRMPLTNSSHHWTTAVSYRTLAPLFCPFIALRPIVSVVINASPVASIIPSVPCPVPHLRNIFALSQVLGLTSIRVDIGLRWRHDETVVGPWQVVARS